MRLTPQQRREECNPVLIGIFVGLISPLTSLIWGIRQRSWSLSLLPYLFVFFVGLIIMAGTGDKEFKTEVRIPLQIISGIFSYEMAKKMKGKAIKNKDK